MKLMPVTQTASGLRDNHTRGSVAEFLDSKIQPGSKLSIVSAYFTIYAYDALKHRLDAIDRLDFLFGEPSFINRLDPDKTEKKAFILDEGGLEACNGVQNQLTTQCSVFEIPIGRGKLSAHCPACFERRVHRLQFAQRYLVHDSGVPQPLSCFRYLVLYLLAHPELTRLFARDELVSNTQAEYSTCADALGILTTGNPSTRSYPFLHLQREHE